ncbi:hypothetical protein E3N88_31009 [Mikania micrantha]|uniref:Uncharacterized protein n=1 Tax=Mikania micrantha TaxID=192012 RepID=A0A5N6MN77_9ASTR|nr:hypothetical protein E3N88_31009 [Mikania micrantha]
MDAERPYQEDVAQQGPPLDPETLALSQHEWLQFEPQAAATTRCRQILRMSMGTPRCIYMFVLAYCGEVVRARAILGEDTPWTRLFEIAELPSYMLITVEFLSTFRYRAHQAAVREEDDEELPPDIEFSLGGQHHEMSIERFTVHLGIYYEPETVRDDFAQGLTQGEEGVMRACEHNKSVQVESEEEEEEPVRRTRKKPPAKRWSDEEEVALAKSWLTISENPDVGNAQFNPFNKEESQQRFRLREEKLCVLQEEKDARIQLMRRQQQALDEQQNAVDLEFMMKDHTIYQEPMLQLILDRKREIAARWGCHCPF